MFRINFNFGTELADIYIDRARADEGGFTPYRVKNLVTRENPAGMLGQVMQQTKLGCGGRNDCAALLQQTLDEEKACDHKLTKLAEGTVNARAA